MKNTNAFHLKTVAAALGMALLAAGQAQSAVTQVGSQAAFSALGTIAQNTNFDSNGGAFFYPGSPVTYGNLTFTEGSQNLIGGINDYGMARSLFTDNGIQGTTISIAGNYDLFALNAGNFFNAGNANFNITTNLGSYSFTQLISQYAFQGSLTFVGFQAGAGEYFTSVQWGGENATGVTDVQIGSITTAVPEPETYAMMLAGLGLLGFAARRRKAKEAVAA